MTLANLGTRAELAHLYFVRQVVISRCSEILWIPWRRRGRYDIFPALVRTIWLPRLR